MSKEQLLRDFNVAPTAEIISAGLGAASNTYTKFIAELGRIGISLMDWRFYNDGKAWLTKGEHKWTTPRGANKVKPIFWMSIWQGFFKISFFFSAETQDKLLALPISSEAKNIIKNSEPMGKTRKFLPITFELSEDKQLKDIYILAEFRKDNI